MMIALYKNEVLRYEGNLIRCHSIFSIYDLNYHVLSLSLTCFIHIMEVTIFGKSPL